MEEWLFKLNSKNNCGLRPDIKGVFFSYFIFTDTCLRSDTEPVFLLDLKVIYSQ